MYDIKLIEKIIRDNLTLISDILNKPITHKGVVLIGNYKLIDVIKRDKHISILLSNGKNMRKIYVYDDLMVISETTQLEDRIKLFIRRKYNLCTILNY